MKPAYFILLLALAFSTLEQNAAAKTLKLGSINHLSEQDVGQIVLPQLYAQLGIEIEVQPLPAKRAESYLLSGALDGEVMRIDEYGAEHPSLLKVPTPYYSVITTAFVHKDRDIQLNGIDDLKAYSVVKIRGVKTTDILTAGLPSVSEVNDTQNMMQLVIRHAADIALTSRVNGLLTLNKLSETNIIAYPLSLKERPVFHYLHKKHADLVPQIDAVILSMKQSGQLGILIKDAEIKVVGGYR